MPFRERVHQPFWETLSLASDPEAPHNFLDSYGNLWSIEDAFGDTDWLGIEATEIRGTREAADLDRWEIVLDFGEQTIASSPRTTPHPYLMASK